MFFLRSGANYDLDGKMKKWWSEESWKRFKEKTKCFADYFSKYQVQGIKVGLSDLIDQANPFVYAIVEE